MLGTMVRHFESLGALAAFQQKQAAIVVPVAALAMGAAADILYNRTRAGYGSQLLPELAQSTQDERVRLGYTPNDPLLRDGSLLRDSVEMAVGPNFAACGTAEKVAAYHEFGYHTKGVTVPPRPVFRYAFEEATPQLMRVIEALAGVTLGFLPITAVGKLATRTSSYEAEIL